MNNVEVTKVKVVKATEQPKPETKAEAPVVEAKTETKPTILEKLETVLNKVMGSYDGKYQEVEEPKKEEEVEEPKKEEEVEEPKKEEGSYDGKYQEESEDCCPHCGCKKAKKAEKKAEEEEDEGDKKMEEPSEPEPKKEEKSPAMTAPPDLSNEAWRKAFGMEGIKPSKSMSNWHEALSVFDNNAFKKE